MADSNIQTPDTVKPITLDEYEERTAHLQENTTSLLSAIADRQVQAAGLATQAYSLASEVNAVAEQASLSFSKKTWEDTATSGTPITAAELNRLENAISSLTTAVNNLQDSVSQTTELLWQGSIHASGSAVVSSNLSKHKLLGFKFQLSPNIVIAKASQQQVTDAVKYNWGIRVAEANFTISGNTITFSGISFAQFVCNHLGESLVFNAGDAANITEIWGL